MPGFWRVYSASCTVAPIHRLIYLTQSIFVSGAVLMVSFWVSVHHPWVPGVAWLTEFPSNQFIKWLSMLLVEECCRSCLAGAKQLKEQNRSEEVARTKPQVNWYLSPFFSSQGRLVLTGIWRRECVVPRSCDFQIMFPIDFTRSPGNSGKKENHYGTCSLRHNKAPRESVFYHLKTAPSRKN